MTDALEISQELKKEGLFWSIVEVLIGKSYIFGLNIILYTLLVSEKWLETVLTS